ncbi:hypothetical protein PCASD_20161 [Puccinia coronata f. sp. avenae]|uniref:Uncharacterized protein n=1 Tax=Puccinia coronata f. sp. avenae TaxID=200324 RepID=A0A2N5SCN2_9BASI|nr:hypothetical protein PCASD_20161 [Puccinia coronata f. sp. avenae]
MSSHVHIASSGFPQVADPKTTSAKESGIQLPVAKSSKAFHDLDMDQLSPPASKQALPSPPTSTPTQAAPVSPRKRKSVNFNNQPLRSARSVPNHRCRPRTIAAIPRTTAHTQNPASVQPTLFSSRSHADQQKRARLSLAAPQLPIPSSPSASRTREFNLKQLEAHSSPLGARSAAKKKLARFYYKPSLLQQVPGRATSPTPSTSAGSKQATRRYSHLARKDLQSSMYSDESSDSDEEVASALRADSPNPRRSSSCSRTQRLRNELNDNPAEEVAELRPILKKTPTEIVLAKTVQQATAENGRSRISLDPDSTSAYRRTIAGVASKLIQKSASSSSGDAPNNTSSPDVTGSSESNRSATSSQNGSQAANLLLASDSDWLDEDSHSHGENPSSESAHSDSADGYSIEALLLSSARSCLLTLQASLLPPPDQMRLDPVSPLAKLTSPQKLKLSKLGTLDGSPREPRGVLPRASTCNPRLELRKNQPRTQKRSWLRSTAILGIPRNAPSPPPVKSGPLRTPESSPVLEAQSLPRVAITLREVEDSYISLHDNLDALMRQWQETGPPCGEGQEEKLRPLFADDVDAALMKCLVREVENLCRHDETPSAPPTTTSTSNPPASNLRDDISRMMPRKTNPNAIFSSSSNNAIALSPVVTSNKSGASTNEIRRRVAEIETGQAALRCIAILWSWPSCMTFFDDSYTQRILSLLIQIPKSSILRRKKNLLAIGLFNHIFKLQKLHTSTLEPHVSAVVDGIASTLYLSAGKSGDKGQKVLCLGLSALQQLTTQVPHHIALKVGKFLEPLLASLTAPDSFNLRHQASAGLGALINSIQLDWDLASKNPGRFQVQQSRAVADALPNLQQGRKEAFKERLSTFTLAYYNDKNTFFRWALLDKQLRRSLNEGDAGWVISVMATMIVLLGKRIRKLDPPLTRVFMPIFNELLRDPRTNHLGSQLWDYYILIMFHWSTVSQAQNPEQVWALDTVQLPFLLQVFRSAYFVPSTDSPGLDAAPPAAPTQTNNRSDQYKSLLQPNKDPNGTELQSTRPALETSHTTTAGSAENTLCQSLDGPQSSSHHILLTAFLYGAIGFVQDVLLHPPSSLKTPSELLATTRACPRFHYLDVIWDQMVDPFLPNILAGPHDEHRVYAYELLAALLRHASAGDTPNPNRWTLERFVHPAYHQPPMKLGSSADIDLEEFTKAAHSSAVLPVEIPALDPLWICSRYDKVLRIIASSISSIQHIKSLDPGAWLVEPPTHLSSPPKQVGPRGLFRVWQELVKSLSSVYQSSEWVFETQLSDSVGSISNILEASIQTPAPMGLREEEQPSHYPNIRLFRNLYRILRHGMGTELMNRKLVTVSDTESPEKTRKISLFFKTLSFVFTSSVTGETVNMLDPEDWSEYGVLAQIVTEDMISAQKVIGFNDKLYELINDLSEVLKACTQERLQFLFGKFTMQTVTEFMAIVEPGVLLDEPPLTPASAAMIDACFRSIQGTGSVAPATLNKFIKVFNILLSRLTQGSLKVLLDGCRASLIEYLHDERNQDRNLVYSTLLAKLRNVDLIHLMSPLDLSDLIVSPFQNQSSLSTVSPNDFLSFVKTAAPAFIGNQEHGVPAGRNSSVSVPSSIPVSGLGKPSGHSPSRSSPTRARDDPTPSMPEKSRESHHLEKIPNIASDPSSPAPESPNPIDQSQAPSSAPETSEADMNNACLLGPISSPSSAGSTSVSPDLMGKSNADTKEIRHASAGSGRIGSPKLDNTESQERTSELLNTSGHDAVKSPQRAELVLGDKLTDPTDLQKKLDMKRADADLAVTSCQSEDALQHGDRESSSSSSPSPVDSLEGLAEIDPRLVHTDPRLPAGPLSAADCHDSESTSLGENDVLKKIEAPSAHLSMGTPWDEDYVDPRLARPNRPFAPFDAIKKLRQLQAWSSNQAEVPSSNSRSALLSPQNMRSISKVNPCSRLRTMPTPGHSVSQQQTPTSLVAPVETHVSPITTSLGALDTLAPFAKRQSGKSFSFGLQKSASSEPAQNAREILQNMTTRKPPGIAKTAAETASGVAPSSQHSEDSSSATQVSTPSEIVFKRKRDEPHCNLADQLNHPSPATSTFAASNLASRKQPAQSCTRTNGISTSEHAASQSSSIRKSLDQSPSTRKSPVRQLLPSLSDSGLDGDSSSDPPPPRKKAKFSDDSMAIPNDVSTQGQEARSGSQSATSSVPPAPCSPHDEEVKSADAANPAALDSPGSESRPRPVRRKGRGSELQLLLQNARQPELLLDTVSSSQLGRISKTASDILVSRARVTRSSSRRSSSNERLPN